MTTLPAEAVPIQYAELAGGLTVGIGEVFGGY